MQLSEWMPAIFLVWSIGLIFVLFRGSIPGVWRLAALLLFLFYCGVYYQELLAVAGRFRADYGRELPKLLVALVQLAPIFLILFWPIALWMAFFAPGERFGGALVRNLSLVTLFYWLFWLGSWKLGYTLEDGLRKILPERVELPELPDPPVDPANAGSRQGAR